MKHLILISVAIFAFSLTASAQTIDLQINGVEIATPYRTVIQKLGKPLTEKKGGTFPCDDGKMLTLLYKGLNIKFIEANDDKEFIVGSVEVTSPKWSVSGINIGASMDDVQKKFGREEKAKKSGLETLSYLMNEGFANFYFRNGKLVKLSWEFNVC